MRHRELIAIVMLLLAASLSRADVVQLKSGGLLRGVVTSDSSADVVRVQLVSGAIIAVDHDDIAEITKRPVKFEHYEAQRQSIADTPEAHWELAEWCRENSLLEQRRPHLERVLDFDPDFKPAHLALGHTSYEGEWITKEEYEDRKREQGLVKFNGRFVPATQVEALQAQVTQSKAEKEWFAKVKLWLNWATGKLAPQAADGLSNLRGIRDPDAMPALVSLLGKSKLDDVRRLFIHLAGQIGGPQAGVSLSTLAIRDVNRELRNLALNGLKADQQQIAQAIFTRALTDPNNDIVRRAAVALAKAGNADSVSPLIRALVTRHRFNIRVAAPTNTLRSDGSGYGNDSLIPPEILAGLRAGQYPNGVILPPPPVGTTKVVPVAVDITNDEVLLALKKLTKHDFGFDEAAWTRWWGLDRHQTVVAPDLP